MTGTADIDGSRLLLGFNGTNPAAPGTVLTLLTHVSGRFQSWPDNQIIQVASAPMRLTYHGGGGSDVVLMAEAPPTIAPLAIARSSRTRRSVPSHSDVGDTFTAPGVLTITATSSNQALVPNANLSIGNTGGARTLTATPLFGQTARRRSP